MKALGQSRAVRTVLVALALVIGALAVSIAPALSASATPGGITAVAPTPTAAPQSIGIWVRLESDKSNVPGVSLTITGSRSNSIVLRACNATES